MFSYLKGRPVTYIYSSVYGFVFSFFFLIYGSAKVVLSVLDHNYQAIRDPILLAIIGLVLLSFAIAYRDLKSWGWYGLIVINSVVVLVCLFGITQFENATLLVLSAAALYGLLAPSTRECLAAQS